jgi:tripartite-type tricarboxylate transporter receptor subunit TctC
MSSTRRRVLFGVAALAAAPAAKAQTGNWPTRPLRIIIPTAPGGSPDMVSRTLGNKLTERFGQPVVVESITQGVGILGNQMVSKSAPDGYTLAMLTGGFTTQAAVMRSLPYDPVRDFAFVFARGAAAAGRNRDRALFQDRGGQQHQGRVMQKHQRFANPLPRRTT